MAARDMTATEFADYIRWPVENYLLEELTPDSEDNLPLDQTGEVGHVVETDGRSGFTVQLKDGSLFEVLVHRLQRANQESINERRRRVHPAAPTRPELDLDGLGLRDHDLL